MLGVLVETTVKVFKRDALILKQLQNYLELRDRSLTQAEFLHEAMRFLLEHNESFLRQLEGQQAQHERVFEEWMKTLLKKMEAEGKI